MTSCLSAETAEVNSTWLLALKTQPCPRCGGSGVVADDREIGKALKTERGKLSLREVSRRMGVSAAYVCDLEHGKRAWNALRIQAYRKALTE